MSEPLPTTLPLNHYTMPRYATSTHTKAQLRSILLATGGNVMACGQLWDIKSEHLGAGVYRVRLELNYGG